MSDHRLVEDSAINSEPRQCVINAEPGAAPGHDDTADASKHQTEVGDITASECTSDNPLSVEILDSMERFSPVKAWRTVRKVSIYFWLLGLNTHWPRRVVFWFSCGTIQSGRASRRVRGRRILPSNVLRLVWISNTLWINVLIQSCIFLKTGSSWRLDIYLPDNNEIKKKHRMMFFFFQLFKGNNTWKQLLH